MLALSTGVRAAPECLQGFAERKLLLLSDVIAYCKSFHNAAVRRARLAAASASTKASQVDTFFLSRALHFSLTWVFRSVMICMLHPQSAMQPHACTVKFCQNALM